MPSGSDVVCAKGKLGQMFPREQASGALEFNPNEVAGGEDV
jgi:hypothetical protein